MPESLTASPHFHLEAGFLPVIEFEKDIELGRYSRHGGSVRNLIYLVIGLKCTFYSTTVLCGEDREQCEQFGHILAVTAHECKIS